MPKVPSAGQTVFTNPVRNAYLDPGTPDFGAGIAQAVGNTAKELDKIQEKRDANHALELFNSASAEMRDALSGDDGVYRKMGKDALGASKAIEQKANDLANKYKEGVSARTAQTFDHLWARRANGAIRSAASHEIDQEQQYNNQVEKATIEESVNTAADNYASPEAIQEALNTAHAAVVANSDGRSEEEILVRVKQATSDIQAGVVEAQMVYDPEGAAAYYKEHEKDILPKVRRILGTKVRKQSDIYKSQVLAEKLFNEGKSEEETLKKARKIRGKVGDDVVTRLYGRFRDQREQIARDQKDAYKIVYDQLEGGTSIVEVKRLPEWDMLTPAQQNAAEKHYDYLHGKTVEKGGYEKYQSLLDLATYDKKKFMAENLLQYEPVIGKTRLDSLLKLQHGMPSKQLALANTIAAEYAKSIFTTKGQRGVKDPRYVEFHRRVLETLDQMGTYDRNDIYNVLDMLSFEVERKGFLHDPSIKLFEARPKDKLQVDDLDMSRPTIAVMVEATRNRGMEITSENVAETFQQTTVPEELIGRIADRLRQDGKPITIQNIEEMFNR